MVDNINENIFKERSLLSSFISNLALNSKNPKIHKNITKYLLNNFENYENILIKKITNPQDKRDNIKVTPFYLNNESFTVKNDFGGDEIAKLFYKEYMIGEGSNNIIINFLLNNDVDNELKKIIKNKLNNNNELKEYIFQSSRSRNINVMESQILKEDNFKIFDLNNVYTENNEIMKFLEARLMHLQILIFNKNDKNDELIKIIKTKISKIFLNLKSMSEIKPFKEFNQILDKLLALVYDDTFQKIVFDKDILERIKEVKNNQKSGFYIKDMNIINDKINIILLTLNRDVTLEEIKPTQISLYLRNMKINNKEIKEKIEKKFLKEMSNIKNIKNKDYILNKYISFEHIFDELNFNNDNKKEFNNVDYFILNNYYKILQNDDDMYKSNKKNITPHLNSLISKYNDENSDKEFKIFLEFYNDYLNNNYTKLNDREYSKNQLFLLNNNFANMILSNLNLMYKIYVNDKKVFAEIFNMKIDFHHIADKKLKEEFENNIDYKNVYEMSLKLRPYKREEIKNFDKNFIILLYKKITELYSKNKFSSYIYNTNYRSNFLYFQNTNNELFNEVLNNSMADNNYFTIMKKITSVIVKENKVEALETEKYKMVNYLKNNELSF